MYNILYIFVFLILFSVSFLMYFSRDPNRQVVVNENFIYSPADGTVMEVTEENNCKIIKIFMSVLNVHVQRSPVSGKVLAVEHKPGKFLNAADKRASFENEQNVITIIPGNKRFTGPMLVKQIAGILARRIVCFKKPGDIVAQGERIGRIKLGSQVDIHIPAVKGLKINVQPGNKVKTGITVVAELN